METIQQEDYSNIAKHNAELMKQLADTVEWIKILEDLVVSMYKENQKLSTLDKHIK